MFKISAKKVYVTSFGAVKVKTSDLAAHFARNSGAANITRKN